MSHRSADPPVQAKVSASHREDSLCRLAEEIREESARLRVKLFNAGAERDNALRRAAEADEAARKRQDEIGALRSQVGRVLMDREEALGVASELKAAHLRQLAEMREQIEAADARFQSRDGDYAECAESLADARARFVSAADAADVLRRLVHWSRAILAATGLQGAAWIVWVGREAHPGPAWACAAYLAGYAAFHVWLFGRRAKAARVRKD